MKATRVPSGDIDRLGEFVVPAPRRPACSVPISRPVGLTTPRAERQDLCDEERERK